MLFKSSVATLSVAATLLSSSAAFDALSNKNLAVYWGSGDNQPRLSHFCADSAIDIIPIGFVNEFPDQAPGGYPGDDFANACWADTFTTPDNKATHLKSHCPTIAEDIPICQGLGKKILLSLGGGAATDASLNDDASGEAFAEFLWKAFGPYDASSTVPRPFGNDVVVDGFDFDVEYNGSVGYAAMIDRLRALYHGDQSRTYYISGAPQCKVPDAQLGPAIRDSWFDFIWIQFYNTAGCSARDFVDGTGHFTYGDYVDIIQNAPNPDVKIFIGLPGGTTAANAGFYITPSEVEDITTSISHQFPDNFGGLMVYEATVAEKNKDAHGVDFIDNCRAILDNNTPAQTPPVSSSTVATSAASTSAASTSAASTSAASTSAASTSGASTSAASSTGSSPSGTAGASSSTVGSGSESAASGSASVTASAGTSLPAVTTTGIWNSTTLSGTDVPRTGSGEPGSPTTSAAGSAEPSITGASGVTTSGAVGPTAATSQSGLVTTVITTVYTDICPAGFTTKTTAYTATYNPATTTAPGSGKPTAIPEGFTTIVTVCNHCAPTITRVTLTVPITSTATAPAVKSSSPASSPAAAVSQGSESLPTTSTLQSTSTTTIYATVYPASSSPAESAPAPTSTASSTPAVVSSFVPVAKAPSSVPAAPVKPTSSSASASMVTMTIVPVATLKPAASSSSAVSPASASAPAAPYVANNGTAPSGSGSAAPSASATAPAMPFEGAASTSFQAGSGLLVATIVGMLIMAL